ncbi:L,D-transpeptidase [Ideonella azotifigens]|uniref:L,D-TPase catalytic domain-containing protein n=2 Tax=Ideonella azotifigens TaxID=513160 RepID=A0ABN1JSB4_9BURK|nr:L,D-transpeptidase [Ideonella azotifigens]MCD2340895.1 L,D-transpeptidase [Ideonella azotifigens]
MTSEQRPLTTRRRGAWLLSLVAGAVLLGWAAQGRHAWDARAAVAPDALRGSGKLKLADELPTWRDSEVAEPEALSGSAESRLLAAYRLVGERRLDAALQVTTALARDYPQFRLGQLLHADLLAAHVQPLAGFGRPAAAMAVAPEASATGDALTGLQQEAAARLHALQQRPPAGLVPAELVRLPASVPHAIVVDASRSRLYLFRHDVQGLQLVQDFYVSVGKQGVDKQAEGDQKTPLGVYYTLNAVAPAQLDIRFGAGALPLNYPNALDRNDGRTGSGILLHGVPIGTYSRPPLDSDGCVAMANDDLLRLMATLPERDTPVVITREIHWVAPAQAGALPASFEQAWSAWQRARLQGTPALLDPLYAPNATLAVTGEQAERFRSRLQVPPAAVDEVSVLTWHDHTPMLVVTFRERAGATVKRDRVVRQYWGQQGADWRIVAEGPVR